MSIFKRYAQYYDLLYSAKDYKGEVQYIDALIKKYTGTAKSILDLGCGTGKHDFILAERNYRVSGVDLSEAMISIAKQ